MLLKLKDNQLGLIQGIQPIFTAKIYFEQLFSEMWKTTPCGCGHVVFICPGSF